MLAVKQITRREESPCRLVLPDLRVKNSKDNNNKLSCKAQRRTRSKKADAKKTVGQKITIVLEQKSSTQASESSWLDTDDNEETACSIDDELYDNKLIGTKRPFRETEMQNAHNSAIRDMLSLKEQERLSQRGSKRMKKNYMPSVRVHNKKEQSQMPTGFDDRNPFGGSPSLQSESSFKRKPMKKMMRLNASIWMPTSNPCLFL